MMEQPAATRARESTPEIAMRAKQPDPLTTPPHFVDMLGRLPLSRLERWNSTSSETPAGEGIGTPKRGPSIGPVGAIERKARVSAWTDDRAARSTWGIRPAFGTLPNIS